MNDLIVKPGVWKKELIQNYFLPFEADDILSIQLGHAVQEDCLLWHFTKEGHYKVKSGYHLVCALDREASSSGSSASQ